uniref:PHD-type domain-containing protein n=1 Tax=Heterorhabditis bacteriophora TaxID=37862 RepID=A0A1I7XU07_HETBA
MKEMLGGCCVCADENGWTDNPLIYCDGPGCEVAVHQGCYGIQEVPEGEWFCAKCHISPSYSNGDNHNHNGTNGLNNGHGARCELCPFGFGALKRTEKHGWAHVICALYIPEVRFGDVHSMDPVILSDVPVERTVCIIGFSFEKPCYICASGGDSGAAAIGACMSCNKPGCKRGFHVTCAQQRGLLCEEGGGSKNVKYCGYCEHHLRKAALDPAIKIIPPCRVRAHPSSSIPSQPTPPSSNNSGHMLVDPLPRPEQVGTVLGLTQSVSDDSHLLNNFSPPLTTSSRSSVALDATPPLSSGGQLSIHSVKQEAPMMNGTSTNNLNALVNAAMGQQAAELTNHNRLGGAVVGYVPAPETNGHHEEKPVIDIVMSTQIVTPTVSMKSVPGKRSRETKTEPGDKPKRPRTNHRQAKSVKALLDLVGPVVSETVSDFQRERVADRSAAERRAAAAATPSTSQETQQSSHGTANVNGQSVGTSPSVVRPVYNSGPTASTLPSSMEQLLERQWEQGSQFLISQAQFDVAQLLTCLHQLKSENIRLEEQLTQLKRRREHLLALTARLSVPLSASQQTVNNQHPPPPTSIISPHHSPHVPSSSTIQTDDSLTLLRSLATGTSRSIVRPPSQTSTPSTLPSSFATSQSNTTGFLPQSQIRTSTAQAAPSCLPTTELTTPPSSQSSSVPSTAVPTDLTANISPERLAALNPLLSNTFLSRGANQMLGGVGGNAMDPLLTTFLLSQHTQQQYLANPSTANLLARFMMPPISGSGNAQGAGSLGK